MSISVNMSSKNLASSSSTREARQHQITEKQGQIDRIDVKIAYNDRVIEDTKNLIAGKERSITLLQESKDLTLESKDLIQESKDLIEKFYNEEKEIIEQMIVCTKALIKLNEEKTQETANASKENHNLGKPYSDEERKEIKHQYELSKKACYEGARKPLSAYASCAKLGVTEPQTTPKQLARKDPSMPIGSEKFFTSLKELIGNQMRFSLLGRWF